MMTNEETFGGNRLKKIVLGKPGKEIIASGPYEYFIYETKPSETIVFNELASFTLYVFNKPSTAKVTVVGVAENLLEGDLVQAEDKVAEVKIEGGVTKFLIAGTKNPHPSQKGLTYVPHSDIYRVEKPWGYELWLNGQHPCYALKQIFIKSGTKTSLQYHNFKQETNVLFAGTAKLHYKKNNLVSNDLVTSVDIENVKFDPVSIIDVVPKTLHRLEAVTDILLYETSTPHLDDVVRVQDDSNRNDGRIANEHKK